MKYILLITIFITVGCASKKSINYLSSNVDSLSKESLARKKLSNEEKDFAKILLSKCYSDKAFDVKTFSRNKLDRFKNSFSYWSSIGSCYLHKGELQKGLFFYKLSFAKAKNKKQKAIYFNNLGVFYTKSNRVETAIEFFNKSIKENSSYKTPHMNLAMIYTQYKLYKNANKHMSWFRGSKDPHIKYLGLIIKSSDRTPASIKKVAQSMPDYLTDEEKEETLERLNKN